MSNRNIIGTKVSFKASENHPDKSKPEEEGAESTKKLRSVPKYRKFQCYKKPFSKCIHS